MKKITFKNPLKEALEFQGKRWTVWLLSALVALAILGVTALAVNMPIVGTISIAAVLISSVHFIGFFGCEVVTEEVEVVE